MVKLPFYPFITLMFPLFLPPLIMVFHGFLAIRTLSARQRLGAMTSGRLTAIMATDMDQIRRWPFCHLRKLGPSDQCRWGHDCRHGQDSRR